MRLGPRRSRGRGDYILDVEKGNDRRACAAVWWGDADPALCKNLAEFVRAHRAELGAGAPTAESTETYGHRAGAHATLRGNGDFRIIADLLCSGGPKKTPARPALSLVPRRFARARRERFRAAPGAVRKDPRRAPRGKWVPQRNIDDSQLVIGDRAYLPFLRARHYLRDKNAALDFSLTQFYRVAARLRAEGA